MQEEAACTVAALVIGEAYLDAVDAFLRATR
jgi:hypothetical protein